MAADAATPTRWDHAALGVLLAALALMPFGSASEAAFAVGALWGLMLALRGRVDWRAAQTRLALGLFAAYWLPELLSAVDARMPQRAWKEALVDLRYLPFLLFALRALGSEPLRRRAGLGVAAILALWLVDALLQAATGLSLGGPAEADRLSGIFGADDLKLGGVVAILSPFLLWPAFARHRLLGALALLAVVTVTLLAGARAAWLALALALAMTLWQRFGGGRRALAALSFALLASIVLAAAGYALSERFAERVQRSAAFTEGVDGLDHALAGRLPIWRTALRMIDDNPINGVGVRGFRHAYADYADGDDPWLGFDGDAGAFHAHQIVLEVASETGAVGLFCWLWAALLALRHWRQSAAIRRRAALPAGIALAAMLFPLNTHYAFYSTAWGGLLFFLLALWLAALGSEHGEKSEPGPHGGCAH